MGTFDFQTSLFNNKNLMAIGSSQFSDLRNVLSKDTRCKDEKYPHCGRFPHRPHYVSRYSGSCRSGHQINTAAASGLNRCGQPEFKSPNKETQKLVNAYSLFFWEFCFLSWRWLGTFLIKHSVFEAKRVLQI